MDADSAVDDKPYYVQSLERGLSVIRAFGRESPELSLTEVARATGLTRAAARRYLMTLVDLGYMRTDGRKYSLRPRILDLGYAYLSGLSLPLLSVPHLKELGEKVHESCSVSVLDGTEAVFVARVPTKRLWSMAISVGTRLPAYATSVGRVLLAGEPPERLDEYLATTSFPALTARTLTDPDRLRAAIRQTRRDGYCLIDQELEDGLRSIAAPVHDRAGRVIAAMNISAHVGRHTPEAFQAAFLPALLESVHKLEDDLHARS